MALQSSPLCKVGGILARPAPLYDLDQLKCGNKSDAERRIFQKVTISNTAITTPRAKLRGYSTEIRWLEWAHMYEIRHVEHAQRCIQPVCITGA